MFGAAKVLNLEGELSRVMREEGIHCGEILPAPHSLFVNTHPVEIDDIDLLIFSLRELRQLDPDRPLVLEIHEGSVTRAAPMQKLRTRSPTCESAWPTTISAPARRGWSSSSTCRPTI